MLVLLCILAGPAVPASVNRVRYASCTALGGIIYLNVNFRSTVILVVNALRSKVQGTSIDW